MGKQTENNKNKSSKKNYSFTGHRVIGENKATHLSNGMSDSDSNTTDDMRKLLESDQPRPQPMNMQGQNNVAPQMGQNFMMNQMQANPFAMGQGLGQNPMVNNSNQFMGDVDPLMVNTLAPVNNARNDFAGFDSAGLMNSSQMAQNMSGLANLAQLGSNNIGMANQYATNAMSETNMGMAMGNMGMNMMGMNNLNSMNMGGMDMNMGMGNMNMGMMENKSLDFNGIKNLANLHSMNILKQ